MYLFSPNGQEMPRNLWILQNNKKSCRDRDNVLMNIKCKLYNT